ATGRRRLGEWRLERPHAVTENVTGERAGWAIRTSRSAWICNRRGRRVLLGVSLVLLVGCAQKDWIDRTLVTENVTGAWTGLLGSSGCSRDLRLDLQQEGSKVTGVGMISVSNDRFPIQGRVAGDVFTFQLWRGPRIGELTVSGGDMNGRMLWGCGNTPVLLHRVDSASRTETPPR